MVDTNISELMEKLPIAQTLKDALISRQGELANYLKLCELLESANWQEAESFAQQSGYILEPALDCFQQGLQWASERIKML